MMKKLRPAVCGLFYPSSRRELESLFARWEAGEPPPGPPGDPFGALLPHAGYVYSGEVAALGWRCLARAPRRPPTVVVVGPSHYVPFEGAAVFAGDAAETPLGDLPLDREAAEFLLREGGGVEFPEAYRREHSVEVHLPLLRRYLPDVKAVPVVTGQGGADDLRRALRRLGERRPFWLVASSDLAHYPCAEVAEDCDRRLLEAVLSGSAEAVAARDLELLAEGHREYHCSHCGPVPLALLLEAAEEAGAHHRALLAYRHSGHVTGDRGRVVGYAAVVFCRKPSRTDAR